MEVINCAIGIDIGGTKTDIALVDSQGKVRNRILIPTDVAGGANAIEEAIQNVVETFKQGQTHHILGIGVGIAGQIEPETGIVNFAPNLRWQRVPFKDNLTQAMGLPVHVINDVRAAAWGEFLFGAATGGKNVLSVFIGTGIGAALIIDGKIYEGSSNTAGELGHVPIDYRGPRCTCGNIGCIEALAGGWGLATQAQRAVLNDPEKGSRVLALAKNKVEEITARMVIQAALENDPFAIKLVDDMSEALASAATGWVNAYNPERMVLGGGIIYGYPKLIEKIRAVVNGQALKAAQKKLEIVEAALKGDAGVLGAAGLVFARSGAASNLTGN